MHIDPAHISMDLHPSVEWDHPSTIVGQQISSTSHAYEQGQKSQV